MNLDTCRIHVDGQIRFEYRYMWIWKFLNSEKKGADSKISGYVWIGPQILKLLAAIVIIPLLIDTNQKKTCMYPILELRDVAKKSKVFKKPNQIFHSTATKK